MPSILRSGPGDRAIALVVALKSAKCRRLGGPLRARQTAPVIVFGRGWLSRLLQLRRAAISLACFLSSSDVVSSSVPSVSRVVIDIAFVRSVGVGARNGIAPSPAMSPKRRRRLQPVEADGSSDNGPDAASAPGPAFSNLSTHLLKAW
eukprot:1533177-Pyramimonas_sp.AAC.1